MSFVFKNLEISLGKIKEKNLSLEKRYNWPKDQILKKLVFYKDIYLIQIKIQLY